MGCQKLWPVQSTSCLRLLQNQKWQRYQYDFARRWQLRWGWGWTFLATAAWLLGFPLALLRLLAIPWGGCCCSYDLGGLYILELSCLVPLHPGEIGLYLSQNFCPVLETCTKSNMCMLRLLLAFASAFSPCGLFLCFFLGMDGFSSALT